ncbi:Rpn family recombination-promoting nuclease/putative transposase [Candidatus Tisiphia endosymbiont of Ceraclea dissimilis]|uniref:Rpn family recombination-promoting nuclease/putative transposase n=1 Tax=Candidatus Tisiphia endosymbiont of Ceraclea dissimilis TaxID=3077928 RepID=UPI003CCAB841
MTKKLKHDSLVKTIMADPLAAQEFLEYYLPNDFKSLVDLSKITVEKESYIEESLNKKYSDIVYGVATKNQGKAFVYVLLEAQSSVDYWTALRLWKYTLLLCERHKKGRKKLPLVYNLVIYNGKEVYTAPRNLWSLFTDAVIAKKVMTEDYQLVDLQSMSDDEITKKKHVGMLEYMLKHIHQRDMIKLWEEFLQRFKLEILVDKEKGYIYIKSFLWYTDSKLPEAKQSELEQVLTKYLSEEEQGVIMRTIAQKYIDEGEARGIHIGKAEGIHIGKTEGKAEGEKQKAISIAKNLLKAGLSVDFITQSTGLSLSQIKSLSK